MKTDYWKVASKIEAKEGCAHCGPIDEGNAIYISNSGEVWCEYCAQADGVDMKGFKKLK